MKKYFRKHWPVGIIIGVWALFSAPFFFKSLVPFPSTYLVTFFPPWSASFGMPVKNNAMPDVISQIYPWKHLTIESWKQFQIPLWNPNSFSGTPHAGNYQTAVFFPLNVLFFILPFISAWSICILLQPLLAGLGMYVFMKTLSKNTIASFISALGFMFCGFIVTWMAYGTLGYAACFIPWAMWAIASSFRKSSRWYTLFLTSFIALSFLAGHFQISLYLLFLVIVFVAYEIIRTKQYKKGFFLGVSIFFALCIVSPQLFLTVKSYTQSVRSVSFIKGEIIPWNYVLTVFAPDVYGNPVTRNDWFGHYAEWSSFIGVVPFLLALFAFLKKPKGYVKFFGMIALFSILFSYPTPLSDLLFKLKIPAVSTSAASRIMILFSFSLAVLAGFGWEYLAEIWKQNEKKKAYIFGCAILVFLILLWLLFYVIKPLPVEALSIAKRNIILPSILGIGFLVGIFGGFIKKYRFIPIVCTVAILVSCCFDAYRYVSKWMPFDPKEYVYPDVKSLTFLKKEIENYRVFGNIGNEVGNMFNIPLVEGYDAMYQGRYGEFMRAVSTGFVGIGERSVVQFDKYGVFKDEALQLMGIKFIIHRISDGRNIWAFPVWQYPNGEMKLIYRDEHYELYAYDKAYPRVFLASEYRIATEKQKIIDELFKSDIDRRETVILEKEPGFTPREGEGKADIRTYSPNKIVIETSSTVNKILFLSDTYDSGWKATIDGNKAQIYRADYIFRAVLVPAGSHTIEFTYMPDLFIAGILVAFLGILGASSMIFWKNTYENRHI